MGRTEAEARDDPALESKSPEELDVFADILLLVGDDVFGPDTPADGRGAGLQLTDA